MPETANHGQSKGTSFAVRAFALLLMLLSACLICGGGWLVWLGGSAYYLLAGTALLGAGLLLWRRQAAGAWLYWAIVAVTLGWAIFEVGFDAWSLMPRTVAWFVVGLWMLLPKFRQGLVRSGPWRFGNSRSLTSLTALSIALGTIGYWASSKPEDPRYRMGIGAFPEMKQQAALPGALGDWAEWGRDKAGTRFSPLTQIDRSNVAKLKQVWTAPITLGERARTTGAEGTPLMVDGTLFACNGNNEVFAIDAETGKRLWAAATGGDHGHTCRGVVHFIVPGAAGACASRILTATGNATLAALDAATGQPCKGFGADGTVDLAEAMPRAEKGYYHVTSAPALVRGKVVVGGWVTDGQYWGEPSGVIRAYDAATGKLAWAWDMGEPDRTGAPPRGQTYTHSTPNNWAPLSADEELGLVYLPLGNPAVDYFGGLRRPFDEKYGSSVVALDAQTGRLRWSFQTTHHDVWDYDVPSQPVLVDLPRTDGAIDRALVQGTKRGEVFVLNRLTGKPLRRVEERPVPGIKGPPGEKPLSPTQPYSTGMASFNMPRMREADMWGITPLDQLACRIRFRSARYEGEFTPPGTTRWITSPGTTGGMNWGSYAVDSDHRVMVVTTGRIAHVSRLVPRREADALGMRPGATLAHAGGGPQLGAPYAAVVDFFLSPLYAPCQAPPYGLISAVDLVSGKLIWSRPIGTARDTGPLGLATGLRLPIGTFMIGGSIATRSGLVFLAATADRTIRALDIRTGEVLWQHDLPHGGFSIPMTYLSPKTGRQFVVMATGSLYGMGRPDGAELVAFALPHLGVK